MHSELTAQPEDVPRRADIIILAPTVLEYVAARLILRHAEVRRSGIGLGRLGATNGIQIVIGLAGGLDPKLPPGTVIVPDEVCLTDGPPLRCDPDLSRALRRGAEALGFLPVRGRLLTAQTLVTGGERRIWEDRGYVAVDMEAALLAQREARSASVRVLLDTPRRSIGAEWLSPARAVRSPRLWGEFAWLAQAAPRFAIRAARVAAAGLRI